MRYFSLEDPALLAAVQAEPLGFVKRLERAFIDEVQRSNCRKQQFNPRHLA